MSLTFYKVWFTKVGIFYKLQLKYTPEPSLLCTITTATREGHQQAVGVENDIHYCLYGVRICSFFQSSITLSLSTPSSHNWSMASSARLA